MEGFDLICQYFEHGEYPSEIDTKDGKRNFRYSSLCGRFIPENYYNYKEENARKITKSRMDCCTILSH